MEPLAFVYQTLFGPGVYDAIIVTGTFLADHCITAKAPVPAVLLTDANRSLEPAKAPNRCRLVRSANRLVGIGITPSSSIAVWSLLIYFVLAYLYFIKDNSVKYVPAVRHRGMSLISWIA